MLINDQEAGDDTFITIHSPRISGLVDAKNRDEFRIMLKEEYKINQLFCRIGNNFP